MDKELDKSKHRKKIEEVSGYRTGENQKIKTVNWIKVAIETKFKIDVVQETKYMETQKEKF